MSDTPSQPARAEAVALRRAIFDIVETVEMEVDLSLRPLLRKRVESAKALCERPAPPAPAALPASGVDAVREADDFRLSGIRG